LVVGGWFGLREKYCWLVANKPSEQGIKLSSVKAKTFTLHTTSVGVTLLDP
jgi:hypothetical protein